MPRLNHGTLLENIVVLEVTRVLATGHKAMVEFASAFAMPPLTQYWHKTTHEPEKNPKFNAKVMKNLLGGTLRVGRATSYSALLLDCLKNAAEFPVAPYAMADAEDSFGFGGPNGALLAAMLMRRYGQTPRIWSNDVVDHRARYCGAHTSNAATECPRTSEYADVLSVRSGAVPAPDAFCDLEFPCSIPALAAWCEPCAVRIGFLDPDSYVGAGTPGPGQVDSAGHSLWLTNLHCNSAHTVGLMFFASRDAPGRPEQVAAFHRDAGDIYPRSVVFQHGNFMVGVKLRIPQDDVITRITETVQIAWRDWSKLVGRDSGGLSWHVDGQHGI